MATTATTSREDAERLIETFIDAWAVLDVDRIMEHFTDEPTWHNMPMEAAVGTDAVRGAITAFAAMSSGIRFEILHQVIDGDLILNERVDHLDVNGRTIPLPVAGVFELRDGKIHIWRDYFDLAAFTNGISGEG